MIKILIPHTIIPQELYVQRDADEQVKSIISDMGRPGYVLVSRQMGKTNLLLNAKRKYESDTIIFIYIDLSNTFPTSKECFENIIDTAIETHSALFSNVKDVILQRRSELKNTPPHKQHTNELRLLLQELKNGKIIIILDEIDALTKTGYSDQIFSQIRSTYFASRVNYKEFNNITYLLSGVIEPNEIIKDPKISPFNIGQKIYLNDFSRSEFEEFIKISGLNIDHLIKERIYYWTNGNPRITWDVCAEIENLTQTGNLKSADIDKLILEMYLTTYDRPPIDSIRELVKNDRELRNALIEIQLNNDDKVSPKLKSRLYLAGIINYEEDRIRIKNEIIRITIDLNWLKSIDIEERGLINIAMDEYRNQQFLATLEAFEKYLEQNTFDEINQPHYYYIMGHCAQELQQYSNALEYFNKAHFSVEDEPIWHYRNLYQRGLTYYYLGKIDESLVCLSDVIKYGKKDANYAKALLNYGGILLKSKKDIAIDQSIDIFEKIIKDEIIDKDKIGNKLANELRSVAFYNLAEIFNRNKSEFSLAKQYYLQAIIYALPITQPTIYLGLLDVVSDAEKKDTLIKLLEILTSNKIVPTDESVEYPMNFNYDHLNNLLIYSFNNYKDEVFVQLAKLYDIFNNTFEYVKIYDLAIYNLNLNKDWDSTEKMLNYVYELSLKMDIEKYIKYDTIKLLAYFSDIGSDYKIHEEYINLFAEDDSIKIDEYDLEIFAKLIFILSENKKYDLCLKYINIVNKYKSKIQKNILLNYLIISHLELSLYVSLKYFDKVILKAKENLDLVSTPEIIRQRSNLTGEGGLEIIRQYAESILVPNSNKNIPNSANRKYNRNDIVKVRFKDGTIIETKYKKVDIDIKNGNCFIITI